MGLELRHQVDVIGLHINLKDHHPTLIPQADDQLGGGVVAKRVAAGVAQH